MPRKPRVEVEGGVYHVYNRVASGERLLADPEVAVDFIERIRSIKERDGWTLFAWCVMTNHYHLAVRRSTVDLATSVHSLQGTFSREFNRPRSRSGGVWQSRYNAKLIDEQRYLSQLVLYIHLNPVRAGVVEDPAAYAFSGHREIVRRVRGSLIDVDDALLCFDERRKGARRAYLAGIRAGLKAGSVGDDTPDGGRGRRWWEDIPWRDDALEARSISVLRHRASLLEQRPAAGDLVSAACEGFSISQDELRGQGRTRTVATLRRTIVAVLMDEWGVPRRELAAVMCRNPEVLSHWIADSRARRQCDASFKDRVKDLDAILRTRFGCGEAD